MQFIIDSGVILNDPQFYFEKEKNYVTVPAVLDELKDFRSRTLAENALKNKLLKFRQPARQFIEEARQFIASLGMFLSETDIQLLALALQLKAEKEKIKVLTDDYSLQNACKLKGIAFQGILMGEIKKAIKFPKKCPHCGAKLLPDFNARECPKCGQSL